MSKFHTGVLVAVLALGLGTAAQAGEVLIDTGEGYMSDLFADSRWDNPEATVAMREAYLAGLKDISAFTTAGQALHVEEELYVDPWQPPPLKY